MRRDLNTCSRQSAMHHVVRVRVFFLRSSEHHSRNDSSSSSTSWSHGVPVFSHIRTRYCSEGSVQQHPPPYSVRKRVLARPVMKRHFFLGKLRRKRLGSLARLMIIWFFRAPPYTYHPAFLRALRYVRLIVFLFFFFLYLGFTRACWRFFGITSYLPQPPVVFASSSIDKHGSQL